VSGDSAHPEIGPELRRLAQSILDRLDPAVRAAAAMATESLTGASRCQQVWCPVCALAALVGGEQHPLLTVIAEQSVSLLTMVRAMAAEPGQAAGQRDAESPSPEAGADAGETVPGTRYERIPIVVEQAGPAE